MNIPSIPLATGRVNSQPTIGHDEVRRLSGCSKEQIASFWDKIRDWFCCTKRVEAKKAIYDMFHCKTADERVNAFIKLKNLSAPPFQNKFTMIIKRHGQMLLNIGQETDKSLIAVKIVNVEKDIDPYKAETAKHHRFHRVDLERPVLMRAILEGSYELSQHDRVDSSEVSDVFVSNGVHKKTYNVVVSPHKSQKGVSHSPNKDPKSVSSSPERYRVEIYADPSNHLYLSSIKKT